MSSCERLFEESGLLVACCPVAAGLADRLTQEESRSLGKSIPIVRERAAAARLAARSLLEGTRFEEWSMPQRRGAPPRWPPGWAGSLSHSDDYGAAALAPTSSVAGIGVDIEPAESLPVEIAGRVILESDVASGPGEIAGRTIFSAKEAVYKAVFPVDGRYLDFHDVTVNLETGHARTNYGRQLVLRLHVDHRIVVVAELAADAR